jgi:hypothetical protein
LPQSRATGTSGKDIGMKSVGLAILIGLVAAVPAAAAGLTFGTPKYLGEFVLPTGLSVGGVEFGGISGMDYDPKTDTYYALSDDRSEHGPARFYRLKIKIDAKGVHGVDIVDMTPFKDMSGATYAPKTIDPESIRFDPSSGHIFWSSEGDVQGNPGVYEAKTDGTMLRQLKLPDYYMPNADHTQGVLDNLSMESLSLSKDGKSLYAGLENGLVQDGGKTTLTDGSLSRIVRFDIASGSVTAEYPIEIEKIPLQAKTGNVNDNGMSEFLVLDNDTILTMERSFALGVGNEIDLYTASLAGATDVMGKAQIKGTTFTPVTKQKVLKIGEGDFGGLDIDNVECLTWGPMVDGNPTIVLASDNNFNPKGQFTQFVVFELEGFKAQ